MLDTYLLQIHKQKFNKYEVDSTCLLCQNGAEDRKHFLIQCVALDSIRSPFLKTLHEKTTEVVKDVNLTDAIFEQSDKLLSLILDCTGYQVIPPSRQEEFEACRCIKFAKEVKAPIKLETEVRSLGLATVMLAQCMGCLHKFRLESSPKVQGSKRYDINVRAVCAVWIAGKSDRLINNSTSNLANIWMHIRTNCVGGKVHNFCNRGSLHARCYGGALRMNLGPLWSCKLNLSVIFYTRHTRKGMLGEDTTIEEYKLKNSKESENVCVERIALVIQSTQIFLAGSPGDLISTS
ncbi:unnamed protein product [Mytilus edulis]|uniref:Uncharacterized protein n=1 Tax=Mytilus edulis TaxID=6550 RepID=A0A8S3UI71_MYTED|nr:unnamed protein product [Mytilus edulis]